MRALAKISLRAMHGTILCALALGAALFSATATAAPKVTGLTHGLHQERVRIILSISEEPAFALFTLNDPDRLILDLPAFDWQLPESQEAEPIPYISALRHGLFRRDRARIVMDLDRPLVVERAFSKPVRGSEPARLVIDLAPTSRQYFDDRAGWPENARWRETFPDDASQSARDGIVVAIDPGHGGIDPGATAGRLLEKTIVLAFSRRLAKELETRDGFKAYLTRDEDVFVPLSERVARAHRAGANMLISVHADAVESGIANGLSVYTLSEKGSDEAAEALAARENRSDVIAGADLGGETDDLTRLLVELAQRGTKVESQKLASAVLGALGDDLELLRTRPMRQANFRVLKAPDIPSILLELGFLNSVRDQKRLVDPEWQAAAARAVSDGIVEWSRTASPGFLTDK
ncbi:MAG: N-acetylmuramoyl-L-alanine amidase [Pseudomonadota bacterium]